MKRKTLQYRLCCFCIFLLSFSCLLASCNQAEAPSLSEPSEIENSSSEDAFSALPDYTGGHDIGALEKSTDRAAVTVVIDAGHGEHDPGNVAGDIYESEINLALALRLGKILDDMGYHVIMIRTDDTALLGDDPAYTTDKEAEARRKSAINADADLYISLHCNSASTPDARGSRIFYRQTPTVKFQGRAIADCYRHALNLEFSEEIQSGTVPTVKEKYLNGQSVDDLYIVLKDTVMPAFLFEVGFMTNQDDLALLQNDNYLWEYAHALAAGTEQARLAGLIGEKTDNQADAAHERRPI